MNGLFFLGGTIIIVIAFLLGRKVQKDADKPVYIPEAMEHDAETFPHHLHDHDIKK